jgi:transposase InsO family protein
MHSTANAAVARRIVGQFVARYNEVRLHSAIGFVTPKDKLEGRDQP